MTEPKPSSQERIHGLDAYRAVLMMLGIVLHAAMPFLFFYPDKFYTPEWSTHILMLTMGVIHVFRMPAFFVLVGFFMALLWEQRGAKATIKNRVERIVLPFLVFVPIIDQILSETSGLVFLDRSILLTHHLWFLYYLSWMIPIVAFAVILSQRLGLSLLPSSRWFKATFESTPRCIFMFTLLSFVPMFLMHWYEVPVDPSWTVNPYKLLFYLL